MTEKLKSCPFCGGEAKLKHGFPSQQGHNRRSAFIQCKKCMAKSKTRYKLEFESIEENDRLVVKAWNRRTDNGEV